MPASVLHEAGQVRLDRLEDLVMWRKMMVNMLTMVTVIGFMGGRAHAVSSYQTTVREAGDPGVGIQEAQKAQALDAALLDKMRRMAEILNKAGIQQMQVINPAAEKPTLIINGRVVGQPGSGEGSSP